MTEPPTSIRHHVTDPAPEARDLVASLFPDAVAAFLAGSASAGNSTAASDLDIVVIRPQPHEAFRDTLRYNGQLVELFVYTPATLREFFAPSAVGRRAILPFMCADGTVLLDVDGTAETVRRQAAEILRAGPRPLDARETEAQRYSLTDALDDLGDSRDSLETLAVAAVVLQKAADLLLAVGGNWTGGGKWLVRRLLDAEPDLGARLMSSYQETVAGGPRNQFRDAAAEVLERAGGQIREGFRREARERPTEGVPSAGPSGTLRFVWFGHSNMEHLEACAPALTDRMALPAVGSTVTVAGLRKGGYVHRLHLALQAASPGIDFVFDNHAEGGATSRDILAIVDRAAAEDDSIWDVAVLGCGINDLWRRIQGRDAEAVGPEEFDANYRRTLAVLTARARRVVCLGDTPFSWEPDIGLAAATAEVARYNQIAQAAAADEGVPFLDVLPAFTAAAAAIARHSADRDSAAALWSDGVHLNELGDTLVLQALERHLEEDETIPGLLATPAPGRP